MNKSEGVRAPPTNVSAKNMPITDPSILSQRESLVPSKILGNSMKYGINNIPVKKSDALKISDEVRLGLPEYAIVRPKSLRKLVINENPGEFESIAEPPVYVIIAIGSKINDWSIPMLVIPSKISCQLRSEFI
jgi:hypothetical protein